MIQLSPAFAAAYAAETLAFRPFGIAAADLEVDFRRPSRPALVTDILECCAMAGSGKVPGRDLLWQLQAGTRTECLLRIAALDGAFAAPFTMRCLNEACGELAEVELSLDDILSSRDEPSDFVPVQCLDQALVLRKPSGGDQHDWAGRQFDDEAAALEFILSSLIIRDEAAGTAGNDLLLDNQSLAMVDRAMQDADSLIDFSLAFICPHCDRTSEAELDLQAWALRRLEESQRKLFATVHRLARHYHWSEQQIFAVPAWRRQYYLRLLENDRA